MWFHRPGFRAHPIFASLVLASACKKGTLPPPPPTAWAELPPREVSKDSALLFTYVEPTGIFATTDKTEKVPSRSWLAAKTQVSGRSNTGIDLPMHHRPSTSTRMEGHSS
jgi:hypothetical protein